MFTFISIMAVGVLTVSYTHLDVYKRQLSAMSGTTNTLVEISDYLYKKNPEGANEIINRLEAKYKQHVNELYSTDEYKQKTQEFIKAQFDYCLLYTSRCV